MKPLLFIISFLFFACNPAPEFKKAYTEWPAYAGSKEGLRYSTNQQINKSNISRLQVAWEYSTNDKDSLNRSQNQCNPLIINGILYGLSPKLRLFALDAANGQEKWTFDPYSLEGDVRSELDLFSVSRGMVYWEKEGDQRILYSVGPNLYAVNATDGTLIKSFGNGGAIDLRENLDRENTESAYVAGTTPGVIYKDLLIMGMRVSEGPDAMPGHIRAFDVRTGELKWIFHTIPHPGEAGYDTWQGPEAYQKIGGANSWAGLALDEETAIVYVPTGSASPDFYGGNRKGQNLYANSLIALEAQTGKYLWHYQMVHHDLWDRDLPANPNLVTVTHAGEKIEAVAQITKHGYIFLFDRKTGKPLFDIKEVPVPASDLEGEKAWPTQPIPVLPENFARQKFEEEDVSDLTPETHNYLLEKYRQVKHKKKFAPPSKDGVWIFPGFDGGGEWGGAAFDPETNIMYINSTELPWSLTMIDVPQEERLISIKEIGRSVYTTNCLSCHGTDLKGVGASYPSLELLNTKYSPTQVLQIIDQGRNMMPSFSYLSDDKKQALLNYLMDQPDKEVQAQVSNNDVPYISTGYIRFLDENGYPGIKPPWGTLNAVNLNSGKLLWKVPLGEYEELTKRGFPPTGTENYGGPVVTKGGLVFIAATKDEKIRAFDKTTGDLLWEAKLPAAGYATPAIYSMQEKQYVVISCGGGKIGSRSGDSYMAFALPE